MRGLLLVLGALLFVSNGSRVKPLDGEAQAHQRGALECDFCRVVFGTAEHVLNSTNTSVIVNRLATVCNHLFTNGSHAWKECEELATAAAKAAKKFAYLLAWDNAYPSNVVCAILFDGLCKLPCCKDNTPQQLYVTFGANVSSSMRATWVTSSGTVSFVRWGTSPLSMVWTNKGVISTYQNGGWVGVIHHVPIEGLTMGLTYYYQVSGDGSTWSPVTPLFFPSSKYPVKIAMVADMGYGNFSQGTMDHLSTLINNGTIDFTLHVGDVAYADGNQVIWDEFGVGLSQNGGAILFLIQIPCSDSDLFGRLALHTLFFQATTR